MSRFVADEADDRREILRIYDQKMRLAMAPQTLEFAVRRTADPVPGAAAGTRYSGDHLNALCRAIARIRLRQQRQVRTIRLSSINTGDPRRTI